MSVKPEDKRSEDWVSGRWGRMNRDDRERILSKVEEKLRKGSSWKKSEKSISRRRNSFFLTLIDLIGWEIIITYWIWYHGNPQGLRQNSFSGGGSKTPINGGAKETENRRKGNNKYGHLFLKNFPIKERKPWQRD